jgi:hypothetical protein
MLLTHKKRQASRNIGLCWVMSLVVISHVVGCASAGSENGAMAGAGPGGASASSGSGGMSGHGSGGVPAVGGSTSIGGSTSSSANGGAVSGGGVSGGGTSTGGVSAGGVSGGGAGGMGAGGLHVDCVGVALRCRNGTVFESLNQPVPLGGSCERMVYSCMSICRIAEVTVGVGETLPPPGSLCYGWQADAGVGGSGGVGN